MELCTGGDLFDLIRSRRFIKLGPQAVAVYLWQMLSGIAHLHHHRFAHRDIKAENYMLKDKSANAQLKLMDFGLSCRFEKGKNMTEKVGTAYCIAPEVLEGSYNELCDIWSIGVTTYYMCVGYTPFKGTTEKATLQQVRRGKLSFPQLDWIRHPEPLKDLIREMLNRDSNVRPHAKTILAQNEWLRKYRPTGANAHPQKKGWKVGMCFCPGGKAGAGYKALCSEETGET